MKLNELIQDEAILTELGRRLAQSRIERNFTQAELARKAGVSKRTLERLESGETTQTRTLLRVFRELDLLGRLDVVVPESTLRPKQMVKGGGKIPKRVSKKLPPKREDSEWTWGDEK